MATKQQTNPWVGVSILLGVLLVVSFVTNIVFVNKITDGAIVPSGGNVPAPSGNNPPPSGGTAAPTANLEIGDAPVKGDEDAPVTIIEYSDFECPFCGRFFTDSYQQIQSEYIDTGKVQFAYKQFPLNSIHPRAQKAAEASLCANEQGQFWEYHDTLFANQGALTIADLKGYAGDLGLRQSQFDSCLDGGKYASQVSDELAEGGAAGVTGTPTLFVNGKAIVGAQPYSVFKAAIDAALAE